jgi:hypothetical protein
VRANAVRELSAYTDEEAWAIIRGAEGDPSPLVRRFAREQFERGGGIEGNVVRIETLPEAKRQYKAVYELVQDIDAGSSEAKLDNGVLTLKLAKVQPQDRSVKLTVN